MNIFAPRQNQRTQDNKAVLLLVVCLRVWLMVSFLNEMDKTYILKTGNYLLIADCRPYIQGNAF